MGIAGGVLVTALSLGCDGGEDCTVGTASCPCYGNATCNPGLLCNAGACQVSGGTTTPPPADCTPGRAMSEACCPTLGVDACGASLVCAALDGRTVPTCYLERSRLGNETCTTDALCATGDCHEQSGTCVPTVGQACTDEVGCTQGLVEVSDYAVLCAADVVNGYELNKTTSSCDTYSGSPYGCGVCRTTADCGTSAYGEYSCVRHRCVLPNTTCPD